MPANIKIAMVKIRSAENLSQLDTYLIKIISWKISEKKFNFENKNPVIKEE